MTARISILFFLLIFASAPAFAQKHSDGSLQDTTAKVYPVPELNRHMLFYLQRTQSINTIIYELNYNSDSTLNEKEPVKVYWIRYAEGGGIAPLSYFHRNYAFGVSTSVFDREKKWFSMHLKGYDKGIIYLINSGPDKRYRAFTNINNKPAILTRVFIKTNGGTLWKPNVVYIELAGKDIHTGKTVVERVKPDK